MMKSVIKLKYIFLLCFFIVAMCGSCVSMMEKAGNALDGSASKDKKISVYYAVKKEGARVNIELREVQNKAAERSIVITINQFPCIKLRASSPNESGEIYFTSLDYTAGSYHGWNEYSMDLFGTGILTFNDTTAVLKVSGKIETVQVSSGRIRRYDTRITGNAAVSALRYRQERISALVKWMKSIDTAPAGLDQETFEKYWKPILFPEMVSKKKCPANWKTENDQWARAEDIRWNISYTGRAFPEQLIEVRNSGTMLRDWEEALPWIYVEYEWERILELLAQENTLRKKSP